MKNTPGIAGKIFTELGNNNININAISQGSSEINITMVINSDEEINALNCLHKHIE